MPRRKQAPKRMSLPDPLFRSSLLAKFINSVMRSGKKSLAEKIVYGALDDVVKKLRVTGKIAGLLNSDPQDDSDGGDGDGGGTSTANKPDLSGDIRSSDQIRKAALTAFKTALENVTPSVEVKSRRVGGSTYQVPIEIRATRRMALAMRWLVEHANKRNEKTMVLRLASEIMDAIEGRGGAVKKREDVHRMAKANQAFAHYRW